MHRQRGRSGGTSGGLGGGAGGGDSELQLQRSRIRARIRALRTQLSDVGFSSAALSAIGCYLLDSVDIGVFIKAGLPARSQMCSCVGLHACMHAWLSAKCSQPFSQCLSRVCCMCACAPLLVKAVFAYYIWYIRDSGAQMRPPVRVYAYVCVRMSVYVFCAHV